MISSGFGGGRAGGGPTGRALAPSAIGHRFTMTRASCEMVKMFPLGPGQVYPPET